MSIPLVWTGCFVSDILFVYFFLVFILLVGAVPVD